MQPTSRDVKIPAPRWAVEEACAIGAEPRIATEAAAGAPLNPVRGDLWTYSQQIHGGSQGPLPITRSAR
ncbi:hypothetical protein GCM10010206_03410 [Streptomyces cinerochromogenes]|nr:hypothetical protein GCM10010206_03410 [Streptomyces cinerochromogenes]